jgi:hypothetical protein
MKNILITVLILVSGFSWSQTNYEKGMTKAFDLWEAGKADEAENLFERIAKAEQDNWLPHYYIAQINSLKSWGVTDEAVIKAQLDKAQEHLDIAMGLSENNPESKVVPLSLQLLLENAVKHNMVTSSKPLHIKIYEDGNYLVVMNNLQPKQIVKKSSGVGLDNIKQRYNLLSDKKVVINQRYKVFAVGIPMLTKQV